MSKKQGLFFNMGKIEFKSFFDEILSLYILGHTKSYIFRKLVEESKITMSYNTFCYHLRKYDNKNGGEKAEIKNDTSEKKELKIPKTVSVESSKFKPPDYYKDEKLT